MSFADIVVRPAFVFTVALLCVVSRVACTAEPTTPLALERTIPLQGVSGRIDHMAVDLGRKHLFVAELGNGTLDVVDLAAGKVIGRIGGLREPQGVAYAPGADILAIANGGDGSVRLFRGADLSPAGTVDLGDDADNVRLDPRNGVLAVGYGSGGLAMIDPAKARHPPRLVVLDANTGGPISTLESCGDGSVNVWQQQAGGVYPLGSVKTASGARTSLFVPELDRLFVASRAGLLGLGSGAGIFGFPPG
jgi:hypothetical protein